MAESEEERQRAAGALTEKERATASPHVEHRRDMPESAFLEPRERKYPVKTESSGSWHYDRDLLLAAEREAEMHGHKDLAARAKEIREREFGSREGARDSAALVAALRSRFSTPQAAMAALGLDSALLGDNPEVMMPKLSHGSALRVAEALKARGKLAFDADLGEVTDLLEQIEGLEGDRRSLDTEAALHGNAGVPPWLHEHQEDEEREFESEEERREDEAADRRAEDMRHRLGHEASDEEWEREEEALEFRPDESKTLDRMPAEDRRRADDARRRAEDRKRIRADDARRRLGRDESEEERERREREEEGEDRRAARDRARLGRDYRRARDRHHRALDALRRHAADYRRAEDARRRAEDARREADDSKRADDAKRHADDARRHADDMRRHADDAKRAHDEMCAARDARRTARDRRRAHDRRADDRHHADDRRAMDALRGEMVSKTAMDQAIQDAIRSSDLRHRAIAEAVEAVRPKAGRIAMDSGIVSESDVYGRALDILQVPHAGITQLAALKQLYAMAPKPGGAHQNALALAADAAPKPGAFDKFKSMFGEQAAKIERI